MGLPHPDKSGLAMTVSLCHCEAGEASRSKLAAGFLACPFAMLRASARSGAATSSEVGVNIATSSFLIMFCN